VPRRCGKGPLWFCGELRGCGRRLTEPRELVLNIVDKSDAHLSAEDVFRAVRKVNRGIGLTTVYRTLDLLVKMNLLSRYDFGDGRARYERIRGTKEENHHHHLVCTSCNRVVNYRDFIDEEVELLKKTEKGLSAKFNFKIKDHLIQYYGLCEKCRGNE